ncbi:MAG TPA: type II secretion system protein [Acidimicrobiia bacterium]|nr:type II secretion system protein [Acidimicrobiia bacterium]
MARGHRGERGETLVEILVTIAVVGITLTGILGGIALAVRSSGEQQGRATAETVLRDEAEAVLSRTVTYVPCATTSSYRPSYTPPSGWQASITAVQYWDGKTPAGWLGTCPSPDNGLQRLTLSATDGHVTETVDVLKRVS